MLWNFYSPDWTKQWKITVPEKGNQKGTFSNLLSINRFIEIHRLKSIILVPPGGTSNPLVGNGFTEKFRKFPFSELLYRNFFTLPQKNKNNNGHTKKSMLYVSHVCIIKKKGTFYINVLSSNGFSGSLLVPPDFL